MADAENRMTKAADKIVYEYDSPAPTNGDLWQPLKKIVDERSWTSRHAFDLGCGNGATCNFLSTLGFQTVGVDPSESGIAIAKAAGVNAHLGSTYDDLATTYGTFPLVISLQVIAHCIAPYKFATTFLSLIESGGIGVIATPYHGYFKNLALAVTGKMDSHFTTLWDGAHIKFFSIATLGKLLRDCGAQNIEFRRVGRIPPVAKTIIAIVRR
jgi:2-polyprenyl-6-hydroxyphenyl methylase/3-demethylubiquinone-9 3-methyltransferase